MTETSGFFQLQASLASVSDSVAMDTHRVPSAPCGVGDTDDDDEMDNVDAVLVAEVRTATMVAMASSPSASDAEAMKMRSDLMEANRRATRIAQEADEQIR